MRPKNSIIINNARIFEESQNISSAIVKNGNINTNSTSKIKNTRAVKKNCKEKGINFSDHLENPHSKIELKRKLFFALRLTTQISPYNRNPKNKLHKMLKTIKYIS
jgi:hypothetical protein